MGSPSRNAVIICVSLFLEGCAFYLILGLAAVLLGQHGAVLAFWFVLLALVWAYVLSLYVQTLKFTANLRGMVGLGASVASFIFLIILNAGFSLAPLGVGDSIFSAVDLALTVVFLLVIWWRGSSLAQDRVDLGVVRRSFQIGMVVLVTAILVQCLGPFQLIGGVLAVGFFAVGLPGLALARFSSELGDSQQMSMDWWIPIAASVSAVLLLALLVAGAGLGGLDVVTRQILGVVGEMGGWIIRPLTVVLGILAGFLASFFSWISGIFGGGDISGFEQAVGRIEQFQQDVRDEAGEGGPPQILVDLIKWLAFLVAVFLVGWVVYWIFRVRSARRSPGRAEESRESLFSWSRMNQDLSATLSEWWRNLGGSKLRGRGAIRDPRTPREFYHSLLSLAEDLGQPRRQWQTPREHQRDLRELLPAVSVASIVDGFQLSHYGDVDAGQAEIEPLRREWQAIKRHLADQERARRAQNSETK